MLLLLLLLLQVASSTLFRATVDAQSLEKVFLSI
jgi:hypothetical protein